MCRYMYVYGNRTNEERYTCVYVSPFFMFMCRVCLCVLVCCFCCALRVLVCGCLFMRGFVGGLVSELSLGCVLLVASLLPFLARDLLAGDLGLPCRGQPLRSEPYVGDKSYISSLQPQALSPKPLASSRAGVSRSVFACQARASYSLGFETEATPTRAESRPLAVAPSQVRV